MLQLTFCYLGVVVNNFFVLQHSAGDIGPGAPGAGGADGPAGGAGPSSGAGSGKPSYGAIGSAPSGGSAGGQRSQNAGGANKAASECRYKSSYLYNYSCDESVSNFVFFPRQINMMLILMFLIIMLFSS